MRIVWKDSGVKANKPVKYRGCVIEKYGEGWILDIPGDNNIYKNHYSALNAIDEHLGGQGQRPATKRREYGIQVIGKKNNKTG